jgi:hypothetical protein
MADALYLLCETRRSPSSSSQRCARHEEIKQRIRSVPSSLTLNVSDSAFLMIGTKRLSHMQHWRGKTKKFCCHNDCFELRDQSMTKATKKGFVLNRSFTVILCCGLDPRINHVTSYQKVSKMVYYSRSDVGLWVVLSGVSEPYI